MPAPGVDDGTQTAKTTSFTGDPFCQDGYSLSSQFDALAPRLSGAPTDTKAAFDDIGQLFVTLADKAPQEIKGDFEVFSEGWTTFSTTFATFDYDLNRVASDPAGQQALQLLDDARFEQASAHVESWLQQHCTIVSG